MVGHDLNLATAAYLCVEAEWERKQRNREYRVAARREKRNRKADEKKQRKLNATILRRMVTLHIQAPFPTQLLICSSL
jgi:hypothetical protein